ncbi:MAG TPA: transcription repressor NadR [Feifaniaceae bacterium]|nr:transcription repressor NadR [Feifaniaceae bacterium]
MDTEERRKRIGGLIASSGLPITGGELAARMGVTRQVVVQDVAVLRAGGMPILATPSGYVFVDKPAAPRSVRVLSCRHVTLEDAEEELMIIVRLGGTVRDVIVEHPVYGELTGSLLLRTPEAVEALIEKLGRPNVKMLSAMTDGVHMHTIEAPNERILDEIERALFKAGILIS